jgi:hypothetical protein
VFDQLRVTDYMKRMHQMRLNHLETIAQEDEEDVSKLQPDVPYPSSPQKVVVKVDAYKKVTQEIKTLAQFYKVKSRIPSAVDTSKAKKQNAVERRSASVTKGNRSGSLPNLSMVDLTKIGKELKLSDYISNQQNKNIRKQKYEDPEEVFFTN